MEEQNKDLNSEKRYNVKCIPFGPELEKIMEDLKKNKVHQTMVVLTGESSRFGLAQREIFICPSNFTGEKISLDLMEYPSYKTGPLKFCPFCGKELKDPEFLKEETKDGVVRTSIKRIIWRN